MCLQFHQWCKHLSRGRHPEGMPDSSRWSFGAKGGTTTGNASREFRTPHRGARKRPWRTESFRDWSILNLLIFIDEVLAVDALGARVGEVGFDGVEMR